jgi:hypothetical protein
MNEEKAIALKIFGEFVKAREYELESKWEELKRRMVETEPLPSPVKQMQLIEEALLQMGNLRSTFNMWLFDPEDPESKSPIGFDEKEWQKIKGIEPKYGKSEI